MLPDFQQMRILVGVRQACKAIRAGEIAAAHIACDADPKVTRQVLELARENGVPVFDEHTMAQLGAACGIDVGASTVCILK